MPAAAAVSDISRIIVFAIFGWASVSKIMVLPQFAESIRDLAIPPRAGRIATIVVPILEACCAVSFIFTGMKVMSIILLSILVAVFIGAAMHADLNRSRIRCWCFGRAPDYLGPSTIVRAILLELLGITYVVSSRWAQNWWFPHHPWNILELLPISTGLIVAYRILAALFSHHIAATRRPAAQES